MIDDWSTYTPGDFLMFSPDTYWRMVATYVSELWYLQLVIYLFAVGMLWLVYRKSRPQFPYLFLAAIWLLPAYAFFLERYATIMLAAPYFAGLFAAQAALLVLEAARSGNTPVLHWRRSLPLIAFALVIQPVTGFLAARDSASFEGVGLMPDTTAIFTLGILLLIGARYWLHIIPVLWLVISAFTLYVMRDIAWYMLIIIVLYSVGIQLISRGKSDYTSAAHR